MYLFIRTIFGSLTKIISFIFAKKISKTNRKLQEVKLTKNLLCVIFASFQIENCKLYIDTMAVKKSVRDFDVEDLAHLILACKYESPSHHKLNIL